MIPDHHVARRMFFLVFAFAIALGLSAQANIYEWILTDPLYPPAGKSVNYNALTPGGAGVDAIPDANLSSLNLTEGYFLSKNLTNANLSSATLVWADFTSANLSNSNFSSATLTGAILVKTQINSANFSSTTSKGLTSAQFYSTASYINGDLTGVVLSTNNLTGWNFKDKNLTSSNFSNCTLKNANLTNANFTSATFIGADTSVRF